MLRRLSLLLPSAVLLLAFAAPLRSLAQNTIIVDGNPGTPPYPKTYLTIQSGIDAASDGDTVQVLVLLSGAGYTENVSFKGKAITVTGVPLNGTLPIVQGQDVEPAFVFQNGETSKSVLSNFNIVNGGGGEIANPINPGPYAGLPGAIYIDNASPTITNNTFTQGFGLYIGDASSSTIANNTFNGSNTAGYPQNGSGITMVGTGTPSILNNTISQSFCNSIYVSGTTPLIQGNTVSGTVALDNAGNSICSIDGGVAIMVVEGATTPIRILGNTIENNVQAGTYHNPGFVSNGPGGGAAIQVNAPALIQNNIIRNNNANGDWGGGIDIEGDSVFVVQNLIYGNNSNCGGGAISLPAESPNYQVSVLVADNTMVDNTSGSATSQYCAPSAQIFAANVNVSEDLGTYRVVIVDNILSGNTNYVDVDCAQADPPNEIYQSIFDHNILYNAGGNFFGPYCVDVSAKYGNLASDPQFNGPTTGDYTLKPTSPAIDAGNNSVLQLFQNLSGLSLTTDITGITPRYLDATGKGYPIIDIGAYEFNPNAVTQAPPQPTTMLLSFTFPPDYHYTLTATTQSPAGTPVGPISFFVDGQPLISRVTNTNSAEINASGVATITDFPLNAGTRALTATYPGHGGNPSFTPAIAIVNIEAIPFIPTHLNVVDNVGKQAPFGSPVIFTVTSTADDGSFPTPVTVSDFSDGTLLTTLNFTDSDSIPFSTVAPSPIGLHPIQAKYAGNLIYSPTDFSDPFVSTGAVTTTTLTCGTSTQLPVGTPINLVATVSADPASYGTPTGNVYFKQNATNIGSATLASGVAQLSPNPVTVPGYNSFTAIYPSQPGFESSISNYCSVYSPALTLTSSAPSPPGAPAYSPITFTAALTGTTILAGKYTIAIGALASANMTPSADGSSATYQTSSLAPGTYNVVASFLPNGSSDPYIASLIQQVTAPIGDFTLTGPPSITFRTESSGSGTVTLTSIYDFSGTVSLTCTLPQPVTYTCALSSNTATLTVDGTANTTLTLRPTSRAAMAPLSSPYAHSSRILLATLFPFTLLAFFRRRRTRSATLLSLCFMALITISLTACGPDKYIAATPPGTYPLTITATGTTLGGTAPITHTLPINMVLTP